MQQQAVSRCFTVTTVHDGAPGNGIQSVTRTYAISAQSTTASDTTAPVINGSWSGSSPAVTETYPYLWAKEVVTYTKSSATTKYYCIGARGDNGVDAQDVEWAYVLTTENVAPTIVAESGTGYLSDDYLPLAKVSSGRIKGATEGNANASVRCTDDPQGVNDIWKYEWEIKREKGNADSNGHRTWEAYSGAMTLHNSQPLSITSANVRYAISDSGTATPADSVFDNERTGFDDFSDIPLNSDKYIWQATKVNYSTGSSELTGKICLGPTTDFLSGTEVYAVSTSNTNPPDESEGNWKTTYEKTKGSYLWTATRVQYTNGAYGYLNKKCVGYWGTDGKSITKQSETLTYAVTAASDDHPAENSNDWKNTKSAAITAYNTAHSISGSDWQQDTVMWTKTDILWSDYTHTILYTAERNPNDGVPGDDGWMVQANPANVILTQNLVTTNNFTTAAVSFTAKKGSTPATITSINVHTSSTFNVTTSGVTAIVTSPKPNGDSYYTEGSFTVDVNVTDPDNGDTVTFTITVPCYANLLGTWKQSIEDGVETSIAEKLSYGIFDDEVHTIEQTGEYIRGWAENTSVITKKVNDGKNLLSVLSGWESNEGVTSSIGYDSANCGVKDDYSDLYSPAVYVEDGKAYCFSLYMTAAMAQSGNFYLCYGSSYQHLSDLYNDGAYYTITFQQKVGDSITIGNTVYNRYYYVFRGGGLLADSYVCINYAASDYLYYPMIEQNDTPTPFDMGSMEMSSIIKQTADGISLRVSDNERNIGSLETRADSIEGRVTNAEGDIGQLKIAADAISLGVTNGWKNYVSNPVATDGTIQTGNVDSYSVVDDSLFGKVYRIAHSNAGDWQLLFTKDSAYSELTAQYVTWFCVVRPVASGSVNFGSGYTTDGKSSHNALVMTYDGSAFAVSSGLSSSVFGGIVFDFTKISSDGWYLCYASAKLPNEQTIINGEDIIGFNTLTGTWDIYYCGIVKGRGCPSIDMIKQGAGLKRAGIDIAGGIINLMAGKVNFVDPNGDAYATPKVSIDPTDGTLHAVNGYFSGEVHATSGDFDNVRISGGIRSPFYFVNPKGTFEVETTDNMSILTINDSTSFNLPWDVAQSGRRITIVNYMWGSLSYTTGYAKITVPSKNQFFFEDGVQKTSLIIATKEVVELLGYGDGSSFFGWIVMNRLNISTSQDYGRPQNVLAKGIVTGGTSPSVRGYTYKGVQMQVVRISTGKYRLYTSDAHFANYHGLVVLATGIGLVDSKPVAASVSGITGQEVDIQTFTSAGLVDGNFSFMIMNVDDNAHLAFT